MSRLTCPSIIFGNNSDSFFWYTIWIHFGIHLEILVTQKSLLSMGFFPSLWQIICYILVWFAILTRTAVSSILHYNSVIIFIFLTFHLTFIMDRISNLLSNHSSNLSELKKLYIEGLWCTFVFSFHGHHIYSSDRINLIKSQFELLQQFSMNKSPKLSFMA